MDKYCVIIDKNYISLQKNKSEPIKEDVLVLLWMYAYILQRVSEEISYENSIQEDIEEFVFEINNANSYEEVLIPEKITNILVCFEKAIQTSDTIDLEDKNVEIHIDQLELRDIFAEVIDDVIMSRIDDISNAEVELELSEDFGKLFSTCVFEQFQELDNNVVVKTGKVNNLDRQIYYTEKLLFESLRDLDKVEKIEIVSEMSEGVPIVIVDTFNTTRKQKYMTFPFWNVGDEIELTVILDDDRIFLKGYHRKTNIFSWLEI